MNVSVAQAPTPAGQRPSKFTWIGIAIVMATAIITTLILLSQRHARPSSTDLPQARTLTMSDARFRADRWFLPADDLLGFVLVPEGPFLMGGDKVTDSMSYDNERWSSASAQGTVDVPAFYIGRYEVTVAQFLAYGAATGRTLDPQVPREPSARPVAFVSWPDALAYCRWLGQTLATSATSPPQLRQLLSEGWEVTLPTEIEWEKAARGGDGRRYPWGPEPRLDRGVFSAQATAPVGSKACPECPFGLLDLSGNVWEWTRSPFRTFASDDSPGNLTADALWVMRGGSFEDSPQNVRAAIRGGADPGVRRATIGFRVALSRQPGTR